MFTLGLIALSKLLSPSHAAHSISLYKTYTQWADSEGIKLNGFQGFVSNRFGRIAHLAYIFLQHRDNIERFMNEVVDINSNKFVLAVSAFVDNEWFRLCADLYLNVGELIIFPLMEVLGIDENKKVKRVRSWKIVREFFQAKLPELKHKRDSLSEITGKDKLFRAVLDETIETLERQLAKMDFFKSGEESTGVDEEKLQYAPLTNSGCETEFAKLDNRIKVSGGNALT